MECGENERAFQGYTRPGSLLNPRWVDSNVARLPVQVHNLSADAAPSMVAMDVSADNAHSAAPTSAVKVTERRAKKRTSKNKRKVAKRMASQKEVPGGIGTSGATVHRQS